MTKLLSKIGSYLGCHSWLIILGICASVGLFYLSSFSAPFYREDYEFLLIQLPRDLFSAIPPVHYHPISIHLFYYFSKLAFGSSYGLYHLVLYLFYMGSFFFIYAIAREFLKSKTKAFLILILYGFNISFFPHFYWIAVSYFTIGSFFFFGAVYFFLKQKPWAAWATGGFILASLGSNDGSVVIFPLLYLLSWYQRFFPRRLIPATVLAGVFVVFRFFILKLPAEQSYSMHVDFRIVKTIQWYILRALNLPEGIRFSGDLSLVILFGLLLLVLGLGFIREVGRGTLSKRLTIFGVLWFLIAGGPFFLLPDHMSAYYLTFAFLGFALIVVQLLNTKALMVVFLIIYFLMAVKGLTFLERTHWIILKTIGTPAKFYQLDKSHLGN